MVQYPKYFAGKRDYVEVANNYHRRGLGIILNSREKIHVVDYSFKVEANNANLIPYLLYY